jgi:hypothetical protein
MGLLLLRLPLLVRALVGVWLCGSVVMSPLLL